MVVNYFKIKDIETKNIENKLKIIANSNTENAEYITRVFEKTINYLFSKEEKRNDILLNNLNLNLTKPKTIVYFDTIKENKIPQNIASNYKELIIIGKHDCMNISQNIKLININKKGKIKRAIKNKDVIIGLNLDNIAFSKYYYNNMNSYYLNVLNKINEISEEELKNDTEAICTKILLDQENFISKYKEDENNIKLKTIAKRYKMILKYSNVNKIEEKYAFYNISEEGLYETKLINELSEIISLLNINEKDMISKIYDIMCERMHSEAIQTGACCFKDDKCAKMRYTDRFSQFRKKRLL